jgi:hypothetical protein
MRRSSARLAFAALVLVIAAVSCLFAQTKEPSFSPPDLSTANNINYPIDSVASGIVVVAVSLNGAGRIKEKDVLRDIPSLTAPVLLSIGSWTFKPAMLDNKAVDSTLIVSIVFNPSDYRLGGATVPVLGKELKTPSLDANGFLPPRIIAGSWAEYPLNSVAQGAVILDARVSAIGHVTDVVAVLRDPSLTTTSINAARNWTFKPAMFNGVPVTANVVVGYVFRQPNIATPVAQP